MLERAGTASPSVVSDKAYAGEEGLYMAGIEAIVAAIAQEADESALHIVADAEDAAQKTLDAAHASAKGELEAERARLADDAELARRRTKSKCDMIVGQRRLANKQALVQSVLERTKDELRSLEPDAYFPMLLQLVGRYATSGTGTLLLSAADEARMPPDFEERANALVRERGGSLKVEGVDEDLGGGFILRYGLVDVSCTLDALFAERADELRDRVAQLLFQE